MVTYTIIIPVYNEEKVIRRCLESLSQQTVAKTMEIIVVDDGSTDATLSLVTSHQPLVTVFQQPHGGAGAARNFGAKKARGDILIFVDADMEFAPDFVEKLTKPLQKKDVIGTYSKEEYLLNKENGIARSWNLNFGRGTVSMEPNDFGTIPNVIYRYLKNLWVRIEGSGVKESYEKDRGHVFRAIKREAFEMAGGFDLTYGYTDDWSISEKLGVLSVAAPGAKYFHRNPDNLSEVWRQARWFGGNRFLTGNFVRKLYNLFRYFPLWAVFRGLWGRVSYREPDFLVFKIVFDGAVFTSVFLSIFKPKIAR